MTAESVVPTGIERPAAPFPDEVALELNRQLHFSRRGRDLYSLRASGSTAHHT